MWDSPSVVAGEEGRSSPIPNDRRGRHPHHSGAGLLRPVIPATCATVSLVICRAAPGKSVSDSESASRNHSVCFPSCRLLLTGRARRSAPRTRGGEAASQGPFGWSVGPTVPHDLRPEAPPRKMLSEWGSTDTPLEHYNISSASSTDRSPRFTAPSTSRLSSSAALSATSSRVTFSDSPVNSAKSVPSASAVPFLTR